MLKSHFNPEKGQHVASASIEYFRQFLPSGWHWGIAASQCGDFKDHASCSSAWALGEHYARAVKGRQGGLRPYLRSARHLRRHHPRPRRTARPLDPLTAPLTSTSAKDMADILDARSRSGAGRFRRSWAAPNPAGRRRTSGSHVRSVQRPRPGKTIPMFAPCVTGNCGCLATPAPPRPDGRLPALPAPEDGALS